LEDGILYFISTFDTYTKKGEGYLWGIYCNNDNLLGFVAVMDLSNSPTLFYAMHPTCRLQGYMKGAIYSVIDYLRKSKLCHKVLTDVYKENNISLHILKQLGFSAYREDDDKVYLSKVLAQ
jgi:RimJ/RimL family protein N-acetyltransferase